jgi:hypothetical protein
MEQGDLLAQTPCHNELKSQKIRRARNAEENADSLPWLTKTIPIGGSPKADSRQQNPKKASDQAHDRTKRTPPFVYDVRSTAKK